MAFTYDISTNRGKVRFLVGDTDATDYFLEDNEIDYLLLVWTSVQTAAVEACKAIAAKLSREADKRIGDLSLSMSQRAAAYLTLAKTLAKSSSSMLSGFAGGISQSSKETVEDDSDRVVPAFTRGMMSSEASEEDSLEDD
jgi:hypothetical protein